VPKQKYSNAVEFRLSEALYAEISRTSSEHHLTLKEFAVASIGLLNDAHRSGFTTKRTRLYVPSVEKPLHLPSLKTPPDETDWPSKLRASLAPHLYDPLAEYADEDIQRLQERGRQAFRFGNFVLRHVSPLEDDPVMFWHYNQQHDVVELVGLPFRARQ
jgi:hypothetical protein